MKHYNIKSKKHYNIKKSKRKQKTKKINVKRGGGLFSSMSFGIPGVGSIGTCPDKQYYDPKYGWLRQTCYDYNGNKVYKTQYPDSGAASGAANDQANDQANDTATPTKPWYQFWSDTAENGVATPKSKPWYQFW